MHIRLTRAHAKLNDALHAFDQDPNNNTLKQRVHRAEAAVARNSELYDSTPAGQNALREAIAHETDDGARELFKHRLVAAEALRAQQIVAVRHNQQKPTDEDDRNEQRSNTHPGTERSVLATQGMEPVPTAESAAGDRTGVGRPSDRGSRSTRLLIGDRQIVTIATHKPDAHRAAQLRAQGNSTPDLYELSRDDADFYHQQMRALKDNNRFAASVYVYDVSEYAEMKLLVTDDGRSGIALKDDEIVSLFSHRDSNYPASAKSMLAVAVEEGGRRLDCFDTALPRIYAESGFVPAARLRWDDEYAPDRWDYDTYRRYNDGRPAVVFMAYDPSAVDAKYRPSGGRYVDDYGAGIEAAKTYSPR